MNETGVKGGLKGKASAFVGGSVSISPQIRFLTASNAQLAQLTATGGVTYGLGGSYEGEISWEGGKLKIASKGKLAAGLGLVYGISGEIDVFAPWRKQNED